MGTKITLPQLGESIHEGTIGKWLKQVGDTVDEFEPLVEIITDKVNAEVPSPMRGTLSAILVQEGETVDVGTVIGEMVVVGAAVEARSASLGSVITAESEPLRPETQVQQIEAAFAPPATVQAQQLNRLADLTLSEEVEASFPNGKASGGWYDEDEEDTFAGAMAAPAPATKDEKKRNRYSPAVRRLAEEHQLDLERLGLRGSGLGGRITRDDVLMYVEQQRQLQQPVPTRALPRSEEQEVGNRKSKVEESVAVLTPTPTYTPPPPVPSMYDQLAANAMREYSPAPATAKPQPTPITHYSSLTTPNYSEAAVLTGTGTGEEIRPLTPMRRAIAEHMVRSVQTSPHAWTIVEVDMTRLVRYRAQVKETFKQREGVDLTYLPFVMKAVVDGLRQFPLLNASWAADGSGVIVKRELNLGVAIDVPDGLVVPVVHRADEKSLVGLARSLNDLITRARNRKLGLADVQGGTFTVNNPGAFGSVLSQPIINQPQAGIVTMESIVKRPVVVSDAEGNDTVVVRSMMNMCLSFDHRVVDGAIAGRFLQFVKKWLETRDYNAGF